MPVPSKVSSVRAADTRGSDMLYDIAFSTSQPRSTPPKEEPVIEAYSKHVDERKALGVPARPLDPDQTGELVKLLQKPPKGKEQLLLDLLSNRVSPGVDAAAEVKAAFLAEIVKGTKK